MNSEARTPLQRAAPLVALAAIMLLGFALRMYRLDQQSLWWDDWNGVAHLSFNNFWESMADSRRMNPEGAPLYHVLQNLAAPVFTRGEYGQRVFNVMLGVATAAVLFVIGRNIFGVAAGLTAAALYLLSPTHIYHAQSLRIYPLEVLIGSLALHSFERMLTTNRLRWVWANAIFNGLICLVHIFGLFAVIAQGAALVLMGPRRWPTLLRFEKGPRNIPLPRGWIPAQFLMMIPSALWVYTMPYRPPEVFWQFTMPSADQILRDLVGDDLAVEAGGGVPWSFNLLGFASNAPDVHEYLGYALMGAFALAALWGAALLAARLAAALRDPAKQLGFERMLLLVAFWLLPVVGIVLLCKFYKPLFNSRYTIYACLALYVLAGGLVSALRWNLLRIPAALLLAALVAYQAAYLVPLDVRTQWRPLAQRLAKEAAPNDLVLVGAYGPADISYFTMCYHLPEDFAPLTVRCESIIAALEYAKCHLLQHAGDTTPPSVWYVLNTHFGRAPASGVDLYCAANGIAPEKTFYPGTEGLYVVKFAQWPQLSAATQIVQPIPGGKSFSDFDYNAMLDKAHLPRTPENLRAMELVIDDGMIYGEDDGLYYTTRSAMIENDRFDLARAYIRRDGDDKINLQDAYETEMAAGDLAAALKIAETMLKEDDGNAAAYMPLASILWLSGEKELAKKLYARVRPAAAVNSETLRTLPIVDAIFEDDIPRAQAVARHMRHVMMPHAPYSWTVIYRMIGLEKWLSPCNQPWNLKPVPREQLDEAIRILNGALSKPA